LNKISSNTLVSQYIGVRNTKSNFLAINHLSLISLQHKVITMVLCYVTLSQNAHACFTGALYTKCVVVNIGLTVMQNYIKCQYGANSNTSPTS